MRTAYPLSWPQGWKRTPESQRTRARFTKGVTQYSSTPGGSSWTRHQELSVSDGVARIKEQLERMGMDPQEVVISTNVRTRLDGPPRSGEREPEDPGAAVYWKDIHVDGHPERCMASDRYDKVAGNLGAIAATLEAMRAIERHGGAEILNRAFTGFAALPGDVINWREVLEVGVTNPTKEYVEGQFRELVKKYHPDVNNGDSSKFHEITAARVEALRELSTR